MTMPRGVTEIDRLIEQGLTLYGEGDLDGALLLWERVLVIDPENPQANSYVEYVRMNYELLTSDGNTEGSGPFGIGNDEPDYQIEILPGDEVAPTAASPRRLDARDEGWVIDDDARNGERATLDSVMLELEADEPPLAGDPGTFESAKTGENVSFDDATREYPGGAGRPARSLLGDGHMPAASSEFIPEVTPAFGSAEDFQTPAGFGAQTTDVRRRDLGFVQPVGDRHAATGPPELKITLRTPVSQVIPVAKPDPDVHRAATADGDAERDDRAGALGSRELTLDLEAQPTASSASGSAYESLDVELAPTADAPLSLDLLGRAETRSLSDEVTETAPSASAPAPAGASDLIDSLPTPRPPASPTKPLPGKTRAPATEAPPIAGPPRQPSPETAPPPAAPEPEPKPKPEWYERRELPALRELQEASRPWTPVPTTDFPDKPTNEISRKPAPNLDQLISAPTRQLGLRSEPRAATDDETTGEVDIHKLRAARVSSKPDAVAIDPIDARSAEILEAIDRNAPAVETREERTRRRITALLERATEWGKASDLERAVTAVDLALSEDPNSALAQKLIHRNRETIMAAFQGFLGDLQRAPQLARPLHELGSAPISPRAAFLLSRVDGTLSLDEILDVSGMPRLEAYRYLCQLFLRGILR